MKHRCNQVLELGVPLGGVAKLFAQDWEGDVTVVMPATLGQVHTKKKFKFQPEVFNPGDIKTSLRVCELTLGTLEHGLFNICNEGITKLSYNILFVFIS